MIYKIAQFLQATLGPYPFSVLFTNVFAVVFAAALIRISFYMGDDPISNILLILTGALLGWALGMFCAPYSYIETSRFSAIGPPYQFSHPAIA